MCKHRVKKVENTTTDLFKKNGTLYFSNKIKTIDHIDLILSGNHIHLMRHVSCKFGYDIQIFNKATVMILVKEEKTPKIFDL